MATNAETLREEVVRLVNSLPDDDLATAARLLKGLLASEDEEPALHTLEDAPEGEPLTDDEREALCEAEEAERRDEVVTHAEARRILFGGP